MHSHLALSPDLQEGPGGERRPRDEANSRCTMWIPHYPPWIRILLDMLTYYMPSSPLGVHRPLLLYRLGYKMKKLNGNGNGMSSRSVVCDSSRHG